TEDIDVDRLSHIEITRDSIAYIIFTSGSTGVPKAIQVRHRNFMECVQSLIYLDSFGMNDIMIQMSRCSFDIHLQEVLGPLIIGATLVVLHPGGTTDFEYLSTVLEYKQITYRHSVPSLLQSFFTYLNECNTKDVMQHIRSLCSIGEPFSVKLRTSIVHLGLSNGIVWNLYGPAETTIASSFHCVEVTSNIESIPIGRPLPNYKCLILDEYFQCVTIGEEGELFVGGVGVFAGYLGREDLTMKALIEINGETFYRTGDLVRMDDNGLIHYIGRKDHQIKLHGQRIELGEIERCLLNTSISACVVIKWGDDHLIAYVQSSDMNEIQLREHCQAHLPPHMIPSMFIVLEHLPWSASGKVDRKCLPSPDFSASENGNHFNSERVAPLEDHLRRIFSDVFHSKPPNLDTSFGQMGGTSLDAIKVVRIIRQEIYSKANAALLFSNPSIRQLARAIEPLLSDSNESSNIPTILGFEDDQRRAMPSLCIEILGVVLLILLWLWPIWMACRLNSFLLIAFMPLLHLLSYVVCQRLLFIGQGKESTEGELYSWNYYRWWFLNSLWLNNNSYCLRHLLGTPFYNCYLRLCGAQIGWHAHIYTTLIDTPWLLEIGESTLIGEEVILSSLSYQDRTYKLQRISIRSQCSISTRCVLYEDVVIEDHVFVEPMSAITGHVATTNDHTIIRNRSLSLSNIIYQLFCLFCLLCIHGTLLSFVYFIYHGCLTLSLPLPVSLALSWLIWSLTSLFIVFFLLKFIVGPVTPGHYSPNSYYYLHKVWLRQLTISSFHYFLGFVPSYQVLSSIILRWLGADIEEDIRFAEFQQILNFPSNLLSIEHGVTTFGYAALAPFQLTKEGFCCIDTIHIGSGTTLGNLCTLMPGTRLSPSTTVGNLTLVTRDTVNCDRNGVLLGIPAHEMPFGMSDIISLDNGTSLSGSQPFHTFLLACVHFFVSKCLIITLYCSLPVSVALFIHTILFCAVHRYLTPDTLNRNQFTFSEIITRTQDFFRALTTDFDILLAPFISGTQLLVYLLRSVGARIGRDVILPNIACVTDAHLTTITDHVRLNLGAYLQCHTFEHRLLKLAPVTVNNSCVLMSGAYILSGSTLQGRNHILPLTLVMKGDQLPFNTNWIGVPAQQTS
ncbi:unnamed protein product, partial [Didymodactylos carnosus]